MQLRILKLFFIFFIATVSAAQAFAVAAPSSCRNVDLNRFMLSGQPADAPPDKIYKFTEMRTQLLRSIDNSQNTQCYADFYRQAIGEVGDYWGERLARAGCEVDNRGRITGSCPDAGEARRSVEFVSNLDRELKTRIRSRLAESQEARAAAAGAESRRDECEVRRPAAVSAADIRAVTCCGTSSGGGGVIRAVEPRINYQTCLGKMRPTSQSFLSGSGLASCVGNAVKAALQQLWDNITAIFSLPGELWAARSQIWALITQPAARAQFARVLMQQFKSFFTDRVEAFKCYNEYEKAQYVCRMGGQLIATFATPSTIGSFLRLATQPAAAAMRAMSSMLSRSPGGGRIMAGIDRANRAARSAADAGARAARAVDDASGGRISAAGRTAGRVGDAIGRPLSAPIERIARSIEGSATFQRMFVNSFRAEKASMGSPRPGLAARIDGVEVEAELLPPAPRAAAAASDAPRLERGQVIDGEFRVVDERPVPAAGRAADDAPAGAGVAARVGDDGGSTPRLAGPAADDVPRLPPPESRALTVVDDAPSARVPDRPIALPPPARSFSDGPSRAPPSPLALPSPTPLPRLAAPDSNVPRLPAPPDVPRLPAPPAGTAARVGDSPPASGVGPRIANPDSPSVNLPDANTRSATNLPNADTRGAALPDSGNRGGVGFTSNTSGGATSVGSARALSPSADSPSRSLARTVDSPEAGSAPRVNAVTNSDSPNSPLGARSVDTGTPVPRTARVSEPQPSARPISNTDNSSTVRASRDSGTEMNSNPAPAAPVRSPSAGTSPRTPAARTADVDTLDRKQGLRVLDKADFTAQDKSSFFRKFKSRRAFIAEVKKLNLQPTQSLKVGNAKYSLSEPFDMGGGRVGVLSIVESGGKSATQLFYRSNSQGVFRLLPGTTKRGWFSKGVGENTLDAPADIQRVLADKVNSGQIRKDVPNDFIDRAVPKFESEYEAMMAAAADVNLKIDRMNIVAPSQARTISSRSSEHSEPRELRLANPQQAPEFSGGPVQSYKTSTGAVDNVRANVFRSKNGELEYTFFEDDTGRAWLASVQNIKAPINSAGIRSVAVDVGDLDMPRFEYHQQIPNGYATPGARHGPRGEYGDAWPYLRETPLIQDYYRSRGLPVPP